MNEKELKADAAALERGLREAVILLDTHAPGVLRNLPSVTMPLHPHGGRALAGAELLQELQVYRAALTKIRDTEGQVCDEFETCTHTGCASSVRAWAIADAALAQAGVSSE